MHPEQSISGDNMHISWYDEKGYEQETYMSEKQGKRDHIEGGCVWLGEDVTNVLLGIEINLI